uniref:Uncharacterized protein n=1 Tax=Lygus hesperus TaxID=30085 RepID=A0A0A9XQR0_LYGHE
MPSIQKSETYYEGQTHIPYTILQNATYNDYQQVSRLHDHNTFYIPYNSNYTAQMQQQPYLYNPNTCSTNLESYTSSLANTRIQEYMVDSKRTTPLHDDVDTGEHQQRSEGCFNPQVYDKEITDADTVSNTMNTNTHNKYVSRTTDTAVAEGLTQKMLERPVQPDRFVNEKIIINTKDIQLTNMRTEISTTTVPEMVGNDTLGKSDMSANHNNTLLTNTIVGSNACSTVNLPAVPTSPDIQSEMVDMLQDSFHLLPPSYTALYDPTKSEGQHQ